MDNAAPQPSAIQRVLSWARTHADVIGLIAAALFLALLAFHWKGYRLERLGSVVIGDQGDTLTFTALVYQAIDNLFHHPGNLGYALFFWGEPAPFALTVAPYGIAVAVLPVYLLTAGSLELTMNLYILATFALTAWAVYLLVRYLLRVSLPVAVLVSLMVAFAQFRFTHVVHIETLSTQFYLFCLYFLHRFIDDPRRKWAVALAVMFWFTFFTSGYMGYMFALTAAITVAYVFLIDKRVLTARFFRYTVVAGLLVALLALPFLSMRFKKSDAISGYSLETIQNYSATPADWFSGSSFLYFALTKYGLERTRGERTLFLGFTPLILALLAWRYRRDELATSPEGGEGGRTLAPRQVAALYGLITLAGYLLSLGPRIRLGEELAFPSPYMLLLQIPGFTSLRVPARFILLGITGTAVLAAYALAALERRSDRITFGAIMALAGGCLALELVPYNARFDWARPADSFVILGAGKAEVAAAPGAVAASEADGPVIPIAAYDWLRQQPENVAVFHFPAWPEANRQYMYGIRFHKHPMLNGQASFLPRWFRDTDWDTFPSPTVIKVLRDRKVQIVMVHNRFLAKDRQRDLKTALAAYIDSGWLAYVDRFDDVDVYRMLAVRPLRSIRFEFDKPVEGTGWYRPEVSSRGVSYAWTSAREATIDTLLQVDRDLDIELRVVNAITPEILASLKLAVNDTPIPLTQTRDESGYIYRGFIPIAVLDPEHKAIHLAFQTDQPVSPASLGRGTDRRELGVCFDWVELRPRTNATFIDFDGGLEGSGWYPPEVDAAAASVQWMAEAIATVELPPQADEDLAVVFRVAPALHRESLEGLTLTCNTKAVRLTRTDEGASAILRGLIARGSLGGPQDKVVLALRVPRTETQTSAGKTRQVGVALDWLWIYPARNVRFEFDAMPIGSGWHETETDSLGVSLRWMAERTATIVTPLPSEDTGVEFRVIRGVTQDIFNSLALSVNGERIALTYDNTTGEHIFQGIIPASAIAAADPNLAKLAFTVASTESLKSLGQGSDTRQLGVAFDWLVLRAVNPPAP